MSSLFTEYNSDPERILNEVEEYLEKRQYEVYSSVAGLCNPVLSRNPFSSRFLNYFLENKNPSFSWALFIKASFFFFLKTSRALAFESFMIFLCSKKKEFKDKAHLVIISFFNFDRTENSLFDDLYLPGLQHELKATSLPYISFPKLYNLTRNPFKACSVLKDVKIKNSAYVSPYELLPRWKIFELCLLMVRHYLKAIRTLRPFSSDFKDQCYNVALLESFQNSETYKFLHFLATKELIKKTAIKKVVLWYENQVIDKCIIKALRTDSRIKIYGCQFFFMARQEQNLFPSKFEIENNLLPDKIFITQKLPIKTPIADKYFTGKGLRYQYLQKYNSESLPVGKEGIFTAFLTIDNGKNTIVYDLLSGSALRDHRLQIKKHPANARDPLPNQHWIEVHDSQEKLIVDSEIIFCTETGVIFEALAMGRQVVVLGSDNQPSHLIPLQIYKDKLWAFVTDSGELEVKMQTLKSYRINHTADYNTLTKAARDYYFQNNDKSITEVLDLVGD